MNRTNEKIGGVYSPQNPRVAQKQNGHLDKVEIQRRYVEFENSINNLIGKRVFGVGRPNLQEVPESWLLRARLRTFSKLF